MIEVKEETIQRIHTLLSGIENAKDKVLSPAFGRALQAGKTEAKRQATSIYHIKPQDFNNRTYAKYNGIDNKPDEIIGSISFVGEPIPLIKFNVSPKTPPKKNIIPKANVIRTNSQVAFSRHNDVFVQQMETGHIGIFKREESGKLKELHAPSTPKMVENEAVMGRIEDKVNEVINKRIDHEIERLLNKNGG